MQYPGRIIRRGEENDALLAAITTALNATMPEDTRLQTTGVFDGAMENAVRNFQARHADIHGDPLRQDGEIGPLTWAVLFGTNSVPRRPALADNSLREKVIAVAQGQLDLKVRERPKDSNRGEEVEAYLKSVGVAPGNAWCCAFLYWCFKQAAADGVKPAMIQTGGCLAHWRKARDQGIKTIGIAAALANPSLVQRGSIFIMDHGGGLGHTGIVLNGDLGFITTIEGNTDASRGRDGGGVYQQRRKLNEVNVGFIDYFA